MKSNQNFFSYVRDGALIVGIALLIPLTVLQINSIIMPNNTTEITASKENDFEEHTKQKTTVENEKQLHKKFNFFSFFSVAILCFTLAFFIHIIPISTGIIIGGIFCLLRSFFSHWGYFNEIIQLLVIGLSLALLILLSYTISKKGI